MLSLINIFRLDEQDLVVLLSTNLPYSKVVTCNTKSSIYASETRKFGIAITWEFVR